jgi:hypothetical protein
MKHLELHRFKKAIGAITFGLFFPNESKRLDQKHGIGKQPDLVLVTPGTQTATVNYLRNLTGWTVKKATAFVKEGHYPKVVDYNYKADSQAIKIIEAAKQNNVIFEIY